MLQCAPYNLLTADSAVPIQTVHVYFCRVRDIADLIPQSNPDGSGHILKPEFRNTLNKIQY